MEERERAEIDTAAVLKCAERDIARVLAFKTSPPPILITLHVHCMKFAILPLSASLSSLSLQLWSLIEVGQFQIL